VVATVATVTRTKRFSGVGERKDTVLVFSSQAEVLNTRTRILLRFLPTLAILLGSGACDKSPFEGDPPIPGEPPAPAPRRDRSAGVFDLDGAVAIERSDPPAPAGDFREDVARFTTLDACVAEHAVIDPLVSDAVRSIGYDTLLRDACRLLQAIKQKDSTVCAAITASSLQSRCETLVAIALQDPDRCPWQISSQKQRGREPLCLAVSTRDARTCAAMIESAQPACEALASGDASRCARANAENRTSCVRDVARFRTLIGGEPQGTAPAQPHAHVEVHAASGGRDPSRTDTDASSSVAGGAVIASEAVGGVAFELAHDLESTLGLPTRTDRPHLTATVGFVAGGPTLTKLRVLVPGVPEMECPSPRCALTVTMPKADPLRGAPLKATIAGTVETVAGTYRLNVEIDTFVRDVVGRMALYGGR
jgi:hypothetical protein